MDTLLAFPVRSIVISTCWCWHHSISSLLITMVEIPTKEFAWCPERICNPPSLMKSQVNNAREKLCSESLLSQSIVALGVGRPRLCWKFLVPSF